MKKWKKILLVIMILEIIVGVIFVVRKETQTKSINNNIVLEYNFNKLDIIEINDKRFYIKSIETLKFDLMTALSLDEYDSISSDVVFFEDNYYKYDIFKDNDVITIVFYKFKDENEGTEMILRIMNSDTSILETIDIIK